MADVAVTLAELAEDFWRWRAASQPDSRDDLVRVERPPGWRPDWSRDAVADRRRVLAGLTERHRALEVSDAPVSVQVDARLIGCGLARAYWELDLLRAWQRNPCFYLDQVLVPVYNLLLVPPPFDDVRAETIVGHLSRAPEVLDQARTHLAGHAAAPFARRAIQLLTPITGLLDTAMTALAPRLPERHAKALPAATRTAADALESFRGWLAAELPGFGEATAIGPEAFGYLLHRIALLPYPAERLRAMGRQEWDRAVATETILRRRHRNVPPPALLPDAARQVARQREDEPAVRRFNVERGILSQPDTLRHYWFAVMPGYLAPLSWLGPCDDLTSERRVDQDALRYVHEPAPDLPYFELAKACDPRTGIVHEGVHAQQMALSWRHPDPVRRHYYDSVPGEGIGFYNEELMLLSGLFDDDPHSAVFIANSMRLRALRVEVDIALAVGDMTVDEAAAHLARAVPLDDETAWQEAVFFAGNPGQGLSYQIGKLQILDLLAACTRRHDDLDLGLDLDLGFDLQAFHDRLWREGNVPLALQRWDLLEDRDHLDEADRLAREIQP